MSIIDIIYSHMDGSEYDESITAMLRQMIKEESIKIKTPPKSYFFITDLTNPILSHYSRINPITNSPELARKLIRGTQLHNFSYNWFKNIPDFVAEEGVIDGAWMGIDRVRGRIDYLIGESILEFKTKDNNPSSISELFEDYPNDVEQLLFYATIHPSRPKINYLVFMKNTDPYDFKVFRIDIKNFDIIKKVMKSRIDILDKSMITKSPDALCKCRYHKFECKYKTNNLCVCETLKSIDIGYFNNAFDIYDDSEFKSVVESAKAGFESSDYFGLTTLNVIAPRKYCMTSIFGLEENYERENTDNEYKACLGNCVYLMQKKHNIDLTGNEFEYVNKSNRDPRLTVGVRWLKYKKSGKEDIIVPAIIKISNFATKPEQTKQPSKYSIAELGIICSVYNMNTGMIIIIYPNLNNQVKVFKINYDNPKQIYKEIKQIMDSIQKAKSQDDFIKLPLCPDFMCKSCPAYKICNEF